MYVRMKMLCCKGGILLESSFDTYFDEFDFFTEHDIVKISPEGILLKTGRLISFLECSQNFKKMNPTGNSNCVGEREITHWHFTFYTTPKPIKIDFLPHNWFVEFFSKRNTLHRFHSLQHKINDFGFTTYDIS